MLWKNRITRSIKRWFFVRGIGNLPQQYANIKGQAERMEFLAKNFGRGFTSVIYEKELEVDHKLRQAMGTFDKGAKK